MSVYGPKIRLPKLNLRIPQINLPKPSINGKAIAIVLIVILIVATTIFLTTFPLANFGSPVKVSWTNNPLDLRNGLTGHAELNLVIINTSEQIQDISIKVTTESKEIIIFCPDESFPTVATNMERKTSCIVRRNPSEKIFSGTYNINIATNIGDAQTTLEVRT
jgi:hypothetical protein